MEGNWEDYVIDGTNMLKNKLGITNQEELTKVENQIILTKLSNLILSNINGNFDSKHLRDLHKYLFGDIYEFAGNYRDVIMYKEQTSYLDYQEIPNKLEEVLEQYKNLEVDSNKCFEVAKYLADFYKALIYVHPFRDGNSRTIREFLREYVLVRFKGYNLDYSKIDANNFKMALVDSRHYPLLLAYEFYNALGSKDIIKVR